MLWVSLLIICVFGGLTIYFHNATFIKWKPTAVYWLFAGAYAGSEYFGAKNLARRMMDGQIAMDATAWRRLNGLFAMFFAALGALNLIVAYRFDEQTWVRFKIFGSTGLLVVFIIAISFWLARHAKETQPSE